MTTTHSAGSAAGERLKRAREAAGYDLSQASARMKLPVHALEALESGEWERLGPPVFVRGQARNYARMLGVCLDDEVLPSPFTTTQIPTLVSHVHVPRYRHVAESLARRAVYIVLTVSAYYMRTENDFYVLALMVATVQGGTQALSRSLFASMIPKERSSEFFGFFSIFEKFGAILGPAAFEMASRTTGSSRSAILSVVVFFLAGAVVLFFVNVDEGQAAARN